MSKPRRHGGLLAHAIDHNGAWATVAYVSAGRRAA